MNKLILKSIIIIVCIICGTILILDGSNWWAALTALFGLAVGESA